MDRRQKRTREALFNAFVGLLAKRPYTRITVQDIIEAADVGRTTFYAHFETKEHLLRALCDQLFGHVVDTALGQVQCGWSGEEDSEFLHLMRHLGQDDRRLLTLLTCENNDLFLRYFKEDLQRLIVLRYADTGRLSHGTLPQEYLVEHMASSFVETVRWWFSRGRRETAEEIAAYYMAVTEPLLQ